MLDLESVAAIHSHDLWSGNPLALVLCEFPLPDCDPLATLESDWPWVRVYVRDMPGLFGQTVWTGTGQAFIEIAYDVGPIQQRVTLAHELQHLVAGKPCTSLCGQNEREVVAATARYLLPDVAEVGGALRRFDLATAAHRLMVTTDVLAARLTGLTDDERDELAGLVAHASEPPAEGHRAARGPRRTSPINEYHCRTRSRTPQPPSLGRDQDARPDVINDPGDAG